MPRQPLVDTPGLPPYGQRSSERRKEQNRLAQRQLRERRQQQEAAQASKLQQQQNEIRRLHRLITDLRSENFNLKNQTVFRRRQSDIPISSLSRAQMMSHASTSLPGGTGVDSSSKPLLARHSIDYSSLHRAGFSTSSDASHRPHGQGVFPETYTEDENVMSYGSGLREPTAEGTLLQPVRLSYDNQTCSTTLASQSCDVQHRSFEVACQHEKFPTNKSYGVESSSPIASSLSSRQPSVNSTWFSASRNTTPTGVEVSEKPWVTSPQKLDSSPQRPSSSKGESDFLAFPPVKLTSFWPARLASPFSDLAPCADLEYFSDSSCNNISIVPADFFVELAERRVQAGDLFI